MQKKTLSEWLSWQESLNPAEIKLGLERIRTVARQLPLRQPAGRAFVVAGTNGKGSCVATLDEILQAAGLRVGTYTSPHLVHYNERIKVNGVPATDHELVRSFEAIETARRGIELTFFEYGTLAALAHFSAQDCDAWVLEVGLGGRLDAVNIIDGDFSAITTVALDHQDWLGDSVAAIGVEKAGVYRAGQPAFYGSRDMPGSVREYAQKLGCQLIMPGAGYDFVIGSDSWRWKGAELELEQLPLPPGGGSELVANISLALAMVEQCDSGLLGNPATIRSLVAQFQLPGRFQIVHREHEWVLDVAHNAQAAGALREKLLAAVPATESTTVVVGMLADKQAQEFAAQLAGIADRWITCATVGQRGVGAAELARLIEDELDVPIIVAGEVDQALALARSETPPGGRIIVCGSFLVVGPAFEWLGLY
jgi:dihydrofolate synthase/folylpolyglutamate synthase